MNFICTPCKNAGDIKYSNFSIGTKELIFQAKKKWHSECLGGTWCDCQHKIGQKNA